MGVLSAQLSHFYNIFQCPRFHQQPWAWALERKAIMIARQPTQPINCVYSLMITTTQLVRQDRVALSQVQPWDPLSNTHLKSILSTPYSGSSSNWRMYRYTLYVSWILSYNIAYSSNSTPGVTFELLTWHHVFCAVCEGTIKYWAQLCTHNIVLREFGYYSHWTADARSLCQFRVEYRINLG
jgi:hypothetical protein